MKNMMRKAVTFLSLVILFTTTFISSDAYGAPANLSDSITSIKITDINQNSIDMEIKSSMTPINGAEKFYYIITDSNNEITNNFNDKHGFYTGTSEQYQYMAYEAYNPLYSSFNTNLNTDIIFGEKTITQGGTYNLNFNNKIKPNSNYQMRIAVGHDTPATATPQIGNSAPTESILLTYHGESASPKYTIDVTDNVSTGSTYQAKRLPNDSIAIERDVSGSWKRAMTLNIPYGPNQYKAGDQWVIEKDNNNYNVIPKPYIEFLDLTNTGVTNGQNAKVTEGEILFSTDDFSELKDGFGYDNSDTGFYVTGTPDTINQTWNYTRGVLSGNPGEVTLRFESDIALTNNSDDIKILDTLTNEDYARGTPSVSGNTLTLKFKPLNPNRQYFVHIPDGALARLTTNYGLGEFNSDVFDRLIFYTEKKPSVVSAYFSPGADHFDPDSSPFRMSSSDEIYRIPELIGVNKIGVGVNQALVVQFDDKISNLNPGKVDVSTNPVNPDLDYSAEINEDNPTELLITFDTSHPDRLLEYNTKYTITVESGAFKDRYGGGVYSENDKMIFKFKTADGFNNAFMRKTAQELNSGILQTPSENIAIDIPKVYIKQLETIHYRDGLISDERTAPNLTNIKIDAEEDVERISVVTDRGVRPNLTRGSGDQFSTTFAGLNADVTDIEVTAYDAYGKVLERRSFRLQGAPGSEFKNDYVPEITDNFGKIVSLYELMKDPEIMEDVLEQIPVSELDRIGVFQPYFEPYDLITD